MSDYISGDSIAVLILRWLPVKTLLRFRCVCKGWTEIIDSPFFIEEHLSIFRSPVSLSNIKNHRTIMYLIPHALPSVDMLNGPIGDEKLLFCGTHHGLVCLYDSTGNTLLLWNPSMSKFLTVPIPDFKDCGWRYIEFESGFGFWIDPCSKEFKIVLLYSFLDKKEKLAGKQGILYSSIRQDWRVIDPAEVGRWVHRPPLMIQGVARWRGERSEDGAGIILSFDFILERFDLIEMPDLC